MLENFKQKRLPHWDYMWKDEQGRKFVGIVMYPGKRKKTAHYMKEMKQRITAAYKTKRYMPITILYRDSFLDLDGRVWDVCEEDSMLTVQDTAGNYYTVRFSDVLHIEEEEDEGLHE